MIWKSLDVQTDKLGRYGLVSAKKIMCAAHENWAFFQSKWWNAWNLLGSPICYAQETEISPANRFLHQFPTQSTPSKANFGAKFTSQNLKAGCIKRPLMTLQQKVSFLLLLLPASAPYCPFQSTLHWPGFWWFPLLWSASEGFQSTIHCNQHKKWKSTLIRWMILISFLHCPSVNQQIIQEIPTFCSALWPSCLLQKERRQLPGPGMVWVQQRPQRKAREWLTPHSPTGPRKKWRKLLPIWELLCNRHCNAMFADNIRTGIATCGGWIWWICSSDSMW